MHTLARQAADKEKEFGGLDAVVGDRTDPAGIPLRVFRALSRASPGSEWRGSQYDGGAG